LIINKKVFTSVIKYNPNYLKYYSSYILIYYVLDYYLNQKKYDIVLNGTRSIAHNTNMQQFLEKFGFKKQYCKLNIVYSPTFKIAVKTAYPFRKIINKIESKLPGNNFLHKINAILRQEKIKKSFVKNE